MEAPTQLDTLQNLVAPEEPVKTLQNLCERFAGGVTFSSSLSFEDQVITHLILTHNLPVTIFTLDTGRHFHETYKTLHNTNKRYRTNIQVYFPDTFKVEELLNNKGPFSFYQSVENRKECCHIRKVEPLKRALNGKSVWVTGIRAEHSPDREQIPAIEWDENNQIYKYHPLRNWSFQAVREFVRENNIPYNPLHDRGYPSIGCEPCTRAVREGEDFRAGRWWWENANSKECGLHEH